MKRFQLASDKSLGVQLPRWGFEVPLGPEGQKLSAASSTVNSLSAALVTVGIEIDILDFVGASQAVSMWCWKVCCKSESMAIEVAVEHSPSEGLHHTQCPLNAKFSPQSFSRLLCSSEGEGLKHYYWFRFEKNVGRHSSQSLSEHMVCNI